MPPARKKARRDAAGSASDFFSAGAIGAVAGNVLRGVTEEEGKLTSHGQGNGLTKEALASVAGARLRVVEGRVKPRASQVRACMEAHGDDRTAWARQLASKLRTTPPKASLLLGQTLADVDDEHNLMGCTSERALEVDEGGEDRSTATFFIETCAASWTYQGFQEAQRQGTHLTANALANLFKEAQLDNPQHPGFLTLRPHLWTHAAPTADVTGLNVHIDVPLHPLDLDYDEESYRRYSIPHEPPVWKGACSATVIEVFAPGDRPLTRDECWKAAMETLQRVYRHDARLEKLRADYPTLDSARAPYDELPDDIYGLRDLLTRPGMHQAAYKSIIQKLHRFQPEWVRLSHLGIADRKMRYVEKTAVLVCTAALCCAPEANCFNPEFARYVKGSTAMLKRTAVSIVEDGGDLHMVPGLMALATATSEVEGYHLSYDALTAVLERLSMGDDQGVFAWRNKTPDGFGQRAKNGEDFYQIALDKGDIQRCDTLLTNSATFAMHTNAGAAWQHSAVLLDMLGAFDGDKTMTHACADMVSVEVGDAVPSREGEDDERRSAHRVELLQHANPAPKWADAEHTQPSAARTIDFYHCFCDQHVARGIGYAALTMERDADGFPGRHRQTWECVAGYNYRTHGGAFDPKDPAVAQVRKAQQLLMHDMLRPHAGARLAVDDVVDGAPDAVFSYKVDRGALAAGLGVLGTFDVKTTREENLADGMVEPQASRFRRWKVIGCLGTDDDRVIVMHEPTARVEGNAKKPRVTPTVQRKVDVQVRDRAARAGYPFSSSVLKGYNRAWRSQEGAWSLTGAHVERLDWSFALEGISREVAVHSILPPQWADGAEETLADDSNARDALMYQDIPGCVDNAQLAVERLLEALTPVQRYRLLGFVKQQYQAVKLPTPSLQGHMGSDQLERALPGDWRIYRVLLLISRIVPAALAPMHIPHFRVVDARMLRVLESWIDNVVKGGDAPWPEHKVRWEVQFSHIRSSLNEAGKDFMDYQSETIDTMLQRDADSVVPVNAHFVALDVGMGKTLLGIAYLCRYLAITGAGKRILWFTDREVVASCVHELSSKWGLHNVKLLKTPEEVKASVYWDIGIVSYTSLSSGKGRDAFADALVAAAPACACCFDETHLLYATGVVRNATALRIAKASPRFLMLTATPVGSSRQKLATTWLSLSSPFEVNDRNVMAASARMLSARIALPFECVEHVEMLDIEPDRAAASLKAARDGSWGDAARLAREGLFQQMCGFALARAQQDRQQNPDGGCFLVADNDAEVKRMIARINELVGNGLFAQPRSLEADVDPAVGVVVGTIHHGVGYNLDRLGVLVMGVYGSNPAKRYQIRGRLKRLTQKREQVHFHTLVPRATMLELLHQRHSVCDAKAESLESIAQEFVLQQQPGEE